MVCGKHEQEGVVALGCCLKSSYGYSRSGVAPHRFEQDRSGLHLDLAHLFGHDEAMILIADQQWAPKRFQSVQPFLGLLEEGVVPIPAERPVLLGVTGPRQGPEACSRAAAENDRDQRGGHRSNSLMITSLSQPGCGIQGGPSKTLRLERSFIYNEASVRSRLSNV